MTLGVGWALLDARTGDNRPHSHIAHQISLALEFPIKIEGRHALQLEQGQAVIVPAGTKHCLVPAGVAVRTIYVDPLFRGMRNLVRQATPVRLTSKDAVALGAVSSSEDARRWVGTYLRKSSASPIDHRLAAALGTLEPGSSPTALAQAVGLSTTRLREIAVHDFGVPTTKLLQWLQLQRAIDALGQFRNLADAAAAGGFSDQAHFTRRLVEWFGVTPSLGLAQLEISVIR
jgi:AraC-like DNA-binding protein